MYTDLNMKEKSLDIAEDIYIVNLNQLEKLKLEMAYALGKGEFSFELHNNIMELINDYTLLLKR